MKKSKFRINEMLIGFVMGAMLSALGVIAYRDLKPKSKVPVFAVGDCLVDKDTDIWENLYTFKVERVGKYSYLLAKCYDWGCFSGTSWLRFERQYLREKTKCLVYKLSEKEKSNG